MKSHKKGIIVIVLCAVIIGAAFLLYHLGAMYRSTLPENSGNSAPQERSEVTFYFYRKQDAFEVTSSENTSFRFPAPQFPPWDTDMEVQVWNASTMGSYFVGVSSCAPYTVNFTGDYVHFAVMFDKDQGGYVFLTGNGIKKFVVVNGYEAHTYGKNYTYTVRMGSRLKDEAIDIDGEGSGHLVFREENGKIVVEQVKDDFLSWLFSLFS